MTLAQTLGQKSGTWSSRNVGGFLTLSNKYGNKNHGETYEAKTTFEQRITYGVPVVFARSESNTRDTKRQLELHQRVNTVHGFLAWFYLACRSPRQSLICPSIFLWEIAKIALFHRSWPCFCLIDWFCQVQSSKLPLRVSFTVISQRHRKRLTASI